MNGTSDSKVRNFGHEDVDSDLRDMTISPDVMELDSEEEREKEGERQEDEKTAHEIQDSQGKSEFNQFLFFRIDTLK